MEVAVLPNFLRRRTVRLTTLLLGALALAGLAPSIPSSAQRLGTGIIQDLDNTQGQFANGVFERTSISPERAGDLPDDREGAVQLAPAGVLSPWGLATEGMSTRISNFGLVALGDYLFAAGGEVGVGERGVRSDKIYGARINRVTGTPDTARTPTWKEYALPVEQAVLVGEDYCAELGRTAAGRSRNSAAGVALPNGGTLGYIYIVGGIVDTECVDNITTPLVQIATVNASGDVTAVRRAPYLPSVTSAGTLDTTTPRGIADAMTTIVRTSTNERFLYVIGGMSLNPTSDLSQRAITRSVLYAKISPADGSLVHPVSGNTAQPWAAADPIAFVENQTGLRDGAVTAASVTRANTNSTPPVIGQLDAILVAGGCHDTDTCTSRHPYVLKATITNPSTGAISWDTTPSTDNSQVSLPARAGLGATFYNGKLYLIGGTTTGISTGGTFTVPTAMFDQNLNAIKLPGSSDFFVGTTEKVLPGAGDEADRTDVAVAVMPALPPPDEANVTLNAAWIFVGGGYNGTGITQQNDPRVSTLIFGKVGGDDEAASVVRAPDGWYYSSIEEVSIENRLARVLSVRWAALVDRSANTQADIKVEFRKTITADRRCRESDFSAATSDRWRPVDGDPDSPFFTKSNTGTERFNVIELATAFPQETFEATCLQFRAQFLQNGPNTTIPNPSATPRLLSLSLEKVLAGTPDLLVGELAATRTGGGAVRDVTISIANLADNDISQTIDVVEATNQPNGSFFVHLCLTSAPLTAASAPPLTIPAPVSGQVRPPCAVAYYEVYNVQMPAGREMLLPASGWRNPNPPYNPVDLRDLFDQPGKYRFGIVIDYADVIPEGQDGELNNRGERVDAPNGLTAEIEITARRPRELFLPIINR